MTASPTPSSKEEEALLQHSPISPLTGLEQELRSLHDSMTAFEAKHATALDPIAPRYRASARNLLHYLAMRRADLRALQTRLAALGLSSLGRAEAHALSSVDSVLSILKRLSGGDTFPVVGAAPTDFSAGTRMLDAHTRDVLGPAPVGRSVRVMVTMPSEAAADYDLIRNMLEQGMDCMRINCAHDGPVEWLQMIEHLRRARTSLSRSCTVLMDLGGPKLRTGRIEPGPCVQKVRPIREAFGRVTAPAILWLTDATAAAAPPSPAAAAVLYVQREWLAAVKVKEEVSLYDARGRRRRLRIADRDRLGVWAELRNTAYLTNDCVIQRGEPCHDEPAVTQVSGIVALEGSIRLVPGDALILTRDPAAGRGATFDSAGKRLSPARVSCSLPEVFANVKPGERICLDDGEIRGIVESVSAEEILVRVLQTAPQGSRLRADKGINMPDSELSLPAITKKDRADLDFVLTHADLIGLSFANYPSDVLELIELVRAHRGKQPGIILKIETQRALARLPALLLASMRHDRVGVMIARGDLAVECGYERLAEAQEEILWMCEAAHCPTIWATQVLETLAKQGMPSRAEITDAAMGHRAECVMLNKGPHITQAVRVLDDILKRMDAHQSKKRAMLRALHMAIDFLPPPESAVAVDPGRTASE